MSRLGSEWHDCVQCRRLTRWSGRGDALDDRCEDCGTSARDNFAVLLARDSELFPLNGRLHLGTNVRLLALGHGSAYVGVVRCGQSVGTMTAARIDDFPPARLGELCPLCLGSQFEQRVGR